MSDIKILEIDDVDEFGGDLYIHVELEVNDKKRESFGRRIDGEDYLKNCWRAILKFNKKSKSFTNDELYYVSNCGGLELSEIQLVESESKEIKNYIMNEGVVV